MANRDEGELDVRPFTKCAMSKDDGRENNAEISIQRTIHISVGCLVRQGVQEWKEPLYSHSQRSQSPLQVATDVHTLR
ncbi:hypothetical protein QJS04_geneDACA006578 [Acorus gramineus]|uniref:Uncharacterized protein n=1 Tax=Acorus gramineus TaxID=55184 RepID=A0AAV9AYY3_ACOGR|nr:hypothetical protein QJS04_geneDACA006578 [Acorus gramineus]